MILYENDCIRLVDKMSRQIDRLRPAVFDYIEAILT